jgi:uncharacterized protein YjbI with pentapeptide repeats
MGKKSAAVGQPAPRFSGKSFLLESTVSDAAALKQFIKEDGGRIVSTVTDSLDYLLTGHPHSNKKTPEQKRAEELNRQGAAIQILNEQTFCALLLPTRDEALLLLAGAEGRDRWRRLWNYWNSAPTTLDFNGLDFRGKDLSWCNFCAVTFIGADLRDANLSGCCLRQVKDIRFDGANLHGAHFSEASHCCFKQADLTEAHINPAVFSDCDFTEATLCRLGGPYSQMTDCVFRKANLREASLEQSKLQQLDFTAADLSEAKLEKCNFSGAKLVEAKLHHADLTDADLAGADLSRADLTDAILINTNLTGATIDGAVFTGATLTGIRLGDIDLTRAKDLDLSQTGGGEIGRNIRELEAVANQSHRLETHAIIELADRSITLGLTSHQNGRSISTLIEEPQHGYHGIGKSFSSALIELTKKFIRGSLSLDSITVKCSKGPLKSKELKEMAVRAWSEAMGIEPPSVGAIQGTLHAAAKGAAERRDEWLALLKTDRQGVKKWNEWVAGAPRTGPTATVEQLEYHLGAGPFRGIDLAGANLDGIDLQRFECDGANFERASLKKALLGEYSSFLKVNFRSANLQGARCGIGKFSGSDFTAAVMKNAHLRVCTFVSCNFQEADLTGADFGYADVRAADFSTATLQDVNWEQTKYDQRTLWPKGFQPPAGLLWKGKGPDPRTG